MLASARIADRCAIGAEYFGVALFVHDDNSVSRHTHLHGRMPRADVGMWGAIVIEHSNPLSVERCVHLDFPFFGCLLG